MYTYVSLHVKLKGGGPREVPREVHVVFEYKDVGKVE